MDGLYQERVRLNLDGRRFVTDRILLGERFRHDIWIPTDAEALAALEAAGLTVDKTFGASRARPGAGCRAMGLPSN